MLDTHAMARQLAGTDLTPTQVAITDAVWQAAEHGEHVMPEQQRADPAALRVNIYRTMLIQTAATIGGRSPFCDCWTDVLDGETDEPE